MSDPEHPSPEAAELDAEGRPEAGADTEDESILDRLRGSGVGVEDPAIVGDPEPGEVDAGVAEDEPPAV